MWISALILELLCLLFVKKSLHYIQWSIWWSLVSLVEYDCVVQELLSCAVTCKWTILLYCLKFAAVKTTDYSDLFSTDPIIADQIISYLMEFCWNIRERNNRGKFYQLIWVIIITRPMEVHILRYAIAKTRAMSGGWPWSGVGPLHQVSPSAQCRLAVLLDIWLCWRKYNIWARFCILYSTNLLFVLSKC